MKSGSPQIEAEDASVEVNRGGNDNKQMNKDSLPPSNDARAEAVLRGSSKRLRYRHTPASLREEVERTKDLIARAESLDNLHSGNTEELMMNLSVKEDIADALLAAITIYGFVDFRKFARDGNLGNSADAAKVLDLPINRNEVVRIFIENLDAFKKAKFNTELYMAATEALAADLAKGFQDIGALATEAKKHEAVSVVVFDDKDENSSLVYSIAVDEEKKIIRVTFRGSVTVTDFAVDGDTFMMRVPNPVKGRHCHIRQGSYIGVHRGFFFYLQGKRKSDTESKYETIVKHLLALLEIHPGFKIHVTGHSLGGSLASLFAFWLAASSGDEIPKPICCCTFASPRWGNIVAARAFQEMEAQHRLRHLRVVNHKDAVTAMPDRLEFLSVVCCQNNIYRPIGIELRLFRGRERDPQFSFPHVTRSRPVQFLYDMNRALLLAAHKFIRLPCEICKEDYVKWHSCKEYSDRFNLIARELEKITMHGLHMKYRAMIVGEDG